ncbi:MAG: DNA-protecting protein DprA [Planctomycetes bacterium]|nr:DNA-protecting protein DprA [Planctomycetota bacterium]
MREIAPEEILGPLNEVEAKNSPKRLYVSGDLAFFDLGPRVSVVGSRQASEDGLKRARSLARSLVEHGIVVVSGMAEGIDTAAHQSSIDSGGRTIAVLGNGLDRFFPASNRRLQEELLRSHLVVSQFPAGTSARRGNFPMRNRTMALLTDATVIVEAGESSGTLHQGWEALRLGRLLFLMESLTLREDLTWPKEMIRFGAQVLARENLEDVLQAMPHRTRERVAF